jgi:glycosyltransferase involved in cell wall biosynthesis
MKLDAVNNPLVSIIVSTYRRDTDLERAISTLNFQTYTNIEILVVDDNAEKDWNEKINFICNKNEKVRYIKNEMNLGSAKTRNVGIEASKGQYITFLDDDDVYLPNKIKEQVQAMLSDNSDYCLTNLNLYDKNEKLIEERNHNLIGSYDLSNLTSYHLKYHLTGTDTFMFKKDYLVKIGMFPQIDIGDEFYLMMNAIEFEGRFLFLNSCNVKAYVHFGEETGLSSGHKKIIGEKRLFEFKKKRFYTLSKDDVKFIIMRHHAVLAYSYYRSRTYGLFLKETVFSILASPLNFIKLVYKVKK